MADLNKVNFMSKTRFNNLASTNDDELYIVETNVADDSEVVHKTGNETIAGNKTFSGSTSLSTASLSGILSTKQINSDGNLSIENTGSTYNGVNISNGEGSYCCYGYNKIEFYPKSSATNGGYIDFHYQGSSSDYTSRLIEEASGKLAYGGSQSLSASNSTSEQTLAVKGWVNDPLKSTNVVHRTGNEYIGGTKIFTQNNFMQGNDDMAYCVKMINADNTSETQSVRTASAFRAVDSNNKIIGDVRIYRTTNGASWSSLVARNYANADPEDEDGINSVISCIVDNEGNIFTSAPTPPAGDNSSQIATTGWCNLSNNNLVHKTGAETIGGAKTFTSAPIVKMTQPNQYMQYSGYTKGTAPSSTLYGWIGTIFDKNGISQSNKMAQVYHSLYANGSSDLTFALFAPISGSTTGEQISLKHNGTNFYTYAPTPTDTTSTSGTQIATTGWVNGTTNNLVHKTGDETIDGAKTFTNFIKRTAALSGGDSYSIKMADSNSKGVTSIVSYYADSSIIERILSSNTTSSKHFYLDVNSKDDGNGSVSISGTATNLNTTQAESGTSSSVVATKGWVNNPSTSTNVVHRSDAETITGPKTFSSANLIFTGTSQISYVGTKTEKSMIRFIDNTAGTDGNGIAIGGGGAVVIGGGESATTMQNSVITSGGNENLLLCNDGVVDVYTNTQSGASSAKHFTFNTDGTLSTDTSPAASDNSTKVATTAWVNSKITSGVTTSVMPDYSSGISFTSTTNYTTPSDGYVYFYSGNGTKFYNFYIYLNDEQLFICHTGDYAKFPILIPLTAGNNIRISDNTFSAVFYPCIGAQ